MRDVAGITNRKKFYNNGYLVVPNILASTEVAELRNLCKFIYQETGDAEMLASRFLSFSQLATVPFRDSVINVLLEILGQSYTMFPNFTVRTDMYPRWHIDSGFLRGKKPGLTDGYIQCAIYLQDQDSIYGGGLDVIPGSHLKIESIRVQSRLQRLIKKVYLLGKRISLNIKMGDLVLWDARLLHQATQPLIRPRRKKLGIYWTVCRKDKRFDEFLSHLANRGTHLSNGKLIRVPRYAEISSIQFPDSYPTQVIEIVRANQLSVASASVKYLKGTDTDGN